MVRIVFCIFLIVLYLFILLIICYFIFNNTLLWNIVFIISIRLYYIHYIEVLRYIQLDILYTCRFGHSYILFLICIILMFTFIGDTYEFMDIEMHYIIHILYIGMYILCDTKFYLLMGVSAIEMCISICQPLVCLSVYIFNIYMAGEYRFTSCTLLLFPHHL